MDRYPDYPEGSLSRLRAAVVNEVRLAGIATGAVPAAILQNGADISVKYPGDQLAPGLKITEIFPEKISASDKSGRVKNFFINEEIK